MNELNYNYEEYYLSEEGRDPGWVVLPRLIANALSEKGVKCYRFLARSRKFVLYDIACLETPEDFAINFRFLFKDAVIVLEVNWDLLVDQLSGIYEFVARGHITTTADREVFYYPIEWPLEETVPRKGDILVIHHDAETFFRLFNQPGSSG